jgi:UPF0755 protein
MKTLRLLGNIVGFLVLCVSLLCMGVYTYYHLPYDDRMNGLRVFIPEGATLGETSRLLQENGVVKFPAAFSRVARLLGRDRGIRAGEYALHSSMSPREVLQRLCSGEVVLHKVTVPEGLTVGQIAGLLEEKGLASRAEILAASREAATIRALGFDGDSLEGYLFPDTYRFPLGLSAGEILKAMAKRFHAVYGPAWRERQAEQRMCLHEVVTLASIVEKETGSREEMPLIASVMRNRLRAGIPLQCDPTVIYGIEGFDGNLTREHIQKPGPYNTYMNQGLPPGPICNPGQDALQAVLYPADTAYLYFVSKNDGTHRFSSTLEEHNRAVEKYQKRSRKGAGSVK